MSQMLDRYFYGKAERDRVRQQAFDLERFLRNEWQKNKRKLKKLRKTLTDADQAAIYQKYGELVTANIYQIKKGIVVQRSSTITTKKEKRLRLSLTR